MSVNQTDSPQSSPSFHLLPLVWTQTLLTLSFSATICHYLRSKPLPSRSFLDDLHGLYFGYICLGCLLFAITSSVSLSVNDCGEVTALVLGYVSFSQSYNMFLQLFANIAIQMWLVRNPEQFDCESFERNAKGEEALFFGHMAQDALRMSRGLW